MSFQASDFDDDGEVMSEINMTPLVDVMLVLLIIFLITIPVITQSVPVELPKAANIPTQTKPENINIAVDKDGVIYGAQVKERQVVRYTKAKPDGM